MIIRKARRSLEVNQTDIKIFDYPLELKNIGLSYQELNGRVPEKGAGKNTVCEECYYILEGTVQVVVDGQEFTGEPGDAIAIKPGSSSYLIAHNLKLVTVTSPDWYEDQFERIE